jgi:hypothetical protein
MVLRQTIEVLIKQLEAACPGCVNDKQHIAYLQKMQDRSDKRCDDSDSEFKALSANVMRMKQGLITPIVPPKKDAKEARNFVRDLIEEEEIFETVPGKD